MMPGLQNINRRWIIRVEERCLVFALFKHEAGWRWTSVTRSDPWKCLIRSTHQHGWALWEIRGPLVYWQGWGEIKRSDWCVGPDWFLFLKTVTWIISAGFPVTLPVRVKAHLCSPPRPFTRTLYQQVFEWRRLSSSLPLGSTRHVASAHLLLSMFSLLLFICLLMFSDTSSCNTGHQPVTFSPLLPPTASKTEPCCTSCCLAPLLC